MEISYTPVQYVYKEVIEEEISKQTRGKIFYFDGKNVVDSCEGRIVKMGEIAGQGMLSKWNPTCVFALTVLLQFLENHPPRTMNMMVMPTHA